MFRFTICALCAFVCAPVSAEVIDGTHGTLYLDGGTYTVEEPATVAWLRAANNADVTVNGGRINEIELFTQRVAYFGTSSAHTRIFAWEGTQIDLHVQHITTESLETIARLEANEGRFGGLRMRLASGDVFDLGVGVAIEGNRPQWNVIYTDSGLDVDGDGLIGIGELNAVRNTFGSQGLGDFDLSGSVDIQDLNFVRNHFGSAYIPNRSDLSAVPESGSLPLGITAMLLLLWRCVVSHRH